MLTSKQRAYLKSIANNLDSIFQIGKLAMTAGIRKVFAESPNAFDPRKYLGEARELIKLNVLDNNMIEAKQAASILADRTGAEVVQVIGNRFILFRQSKKKPIIELPK